VDVIMTRNNLRLAVGLKPHDKFEYEQLLLLRERMSGVPHDVAIRERFRCTGRTTEMLLAALYDAYVTHRRVLVIAHNAMLARHMRDTMMEWLRRLRTEPTDISAKTITISEAASITFVASTAPEVGPQFAWDAIHHDHVVGGAP
jgi:hypothetical protein